VAEFRQVHGIILSRIKFTGIGLDNLHLRSAEELRLINHLSLSISKSVR